MVGSVRVADRSRHARAATDNSALHGGQLVTVRGVQRGQVAGVLWRAADALRRSSRRIALPRADQRDGLCARSFKPAHALTVFSGVVAGLACWHGQEAVPAFGVARGWLVTSVLRSLCVCWRAFAGVGSTPQAVGRLFVV